MSTNKKSGRRRGIMTAITEHWLPFLTAIFVLATAVAGLYAQRATSERNQLQDDSASLEVQVTQLSETNRRLLASNENLEAENATLRKQLEGTASTTASTTPEETAKLFRQTGSTPLVVPGQSGVDLDSQASNWRADSPLGKDLSVGTDASTIWGKTLAIVKATPNLEACQSQTVLQTNLSTAQTVVGQKICVRTSEDRWAYVKIAAIDRSARTMSFNIVVWKLPTDP
jgi:cell division protein FtsB